MTLYDVYDIYDIATEGSLKDVWEEIKKKVGAFFKELKNKFDMFCNNILKSIRTFKDKLFKEKSGGKTIIYVSDMDNKKFNERKSFLNDIFSKADKVYTEVSNDADSVFTGEIIVDNVDTGETRKNIDAIDVEFQPIKSDQKTNDAVKKTPMPLGRIFEAFEELSRKFRQAMANSSAKLQGFEKRAIRSTDTFMDKIDSTPNGVLRYIMLVGIYVYKIVLVPLRAILSVLKYITSLASRPSSSAA